MIFQPTLLRAIQVIAEKTPDLEKRITAMLETLLEGAMLEASFSNQQVSAPQVSSQTADRQFNTLNKNQTPVEFTFSSLERGVRYTTELSAIAQKDRLTKAEQLIQLVSGQALSSALSGQLYQLQSEGPLKWGTWIGVRHCMEKWPELVSDRYKLYVQVPDSGSKTAEDLMHQAMSTVDDAGDHVLPPGLLPDNQARLVAIGLPLNLSRTEFYFRLNHPMLAYWQINYLLGLVGLADRQIDLLDLVEATRGYSISQPHPRLPKSVYGFSISLSATGEPTVFSLFTFATPFLGSDRQIRQSVLSLAARRNWDFQSYAALTDPVVDQQTYQYHNALSFVIASKGPPGLYVSLSPPDAVAVGDLAQCA